MIHLKVGDKVNKLGENAVSYFIISNYKETCIVQNVLPGPYKMYDSIIHFVRC